MEKINILELLKDCPAGMELDCLLYDGVIFEEIEDDIEYPISIRTKEGETWNLTSTGCWDDSPSAKCVIFPKGKTTWEGFVPPCKFKGGDWITDGVSKCQIYFIDDTQYWYSENCILGSIESVDKQYHLWTINDAKDGDVLFHSDSASNGIFIFKEILQLGTLQKVICYCDYDSEDGFCLGENHTCCWADSKILRPATEERRNRLFQKMREAGYRWNSETKTLEKLFPYNIGTKVWVKSDKEHKYIHTIVGISHNSFGNLEYEVKEEKTGIIVHYPKELLIPVTKELNFKVGDIIRSKNCPAAGSFIIVGTKEDSYLINIKGHCIKFDDQDNYELVPKKFNLNTLKPFAEVLVRNTNNGRWRGQFYMSYDENEEYPFECVYNCWKQCIPYKGNEFLRGTSDECKDFYKTWE